MFQLDSCALATCHSFIAEHLFNRVMLCGWHLTKATQLKYPKHLFHFHTMAPPVEDLLRHHIISTTCRLASVDCWQVAGAAEQLSPRWTHFNYGSGFLPADFTLSRLSTHSDKMGRRATIGVAPAAKETLSKPSKCLSHYTGAEIKPGKHWLTSVSFLWDPMSPAAKGDLLIGMVSLYGNSSGKELVNTGKWNSARAEKKTLGFIMHSL